MTSSIATLLGDGRVLIIAGNDGTKNSAYLYDSAAQTFAFTGSTVTGQIGGWATLLRDGRVLIAGGVTGYLNGVAQIANPEVYDPSTGKFTATGAFATKATLDAKGGPDVSAASLLPDGKVLFAAEPTSEIYDPVSGSFSLTGSMTTLCFYGEKPTYIVSRTATVLQNGKVLLTGGSNGIGASRDEDCGFSPNAELYDPSNGKFNPTGDMTRVG